VVRKINNEDPHKLTSINVPLRVLLITCIFPNCSVMAQCLYVVSLFLLLQCAHSLNHLYFLTTINQDQTGMYFQKVGSFNPSTSEIVTFKKFPVVGMNLVVIQS
jgi:hypothetical protein